MMAASFSSREEDAGLRSQTFLAIEKYKRTVKTDAHRVVEAAKVDICFFTVRTKPFFFYSRN